jgi:hypothetical protein
MQPENINLKTDLVVLVGSIYLGIIVIFASFYMLRVFQFKKVYARNYFIILFSLFLMSLAFFFYPSGGNYGMVYILSFPVAYISTNYFVHAKKSKGNYILFILGVLLFLAGVGYRVYSGN